LNAAVCLSVCLSHRRRLEYIDLERAVELFGLLAVSEDIHGTQE